MTTPLVSVVTSAYNGCRYLQSSLESIIRQHGVKFELIVVDDGSQDSSSEILEDLSRRDCRLRVFRREHQGLTEALIFGCREARGEFIARHDADDLSLPGRLSRQAERLRENPRLTMVSCWAAAIGPECEPLWETRRPEEPLLATDLLLSHRQGPPGHGSVMFRKSAYDRVGGYRREFYFAQDSDLWLRLAEIGEIAYEPALLYAYRVTEDCISSQHRKIQNQFGELAHECRQARRAQRPEVAVLAKAALLRPASVPRRKVDRAAGAYFIACCLLARRDPRARKYFRKTLLRCPWKLKAWTALVPAWMLTRSS